MMTDASVVRCHVCGEPLGNPRHGFDRRIQSLSVMRRDGEPVTACNVVFDEELHAYCSKACWNAHEPHLVAALRLRHTYPGTSGAEPCSRCGKPVDRTEPHVAYSIAELRVADEGILMGHCLHDRDFAVLCRDCEAPEPIADTEEWAPEASATAP